MAAPIIFKGTKAQLLNSADLSFKDGTTIVPYAGNPNGAVTRTKGSIICDKTNGKLYINTDGATAWAELTQDAAAATLEFTGFTNQDYVDVAYDSVNKTITLTGSYTAYWRGQPVPSLSSGFVSPAHVANLDTIYYLYYDGTLTWDTNPWSFDKMQIAYVYYGTTDKFALRETHGLMPWETHRELHTTIGTYKYSGGSETAVTLNDTTPASRRPSFQPLYVMDEDLRTYVELLAAGSYTRAYLTGSGTINFAKSSSDIINLSTNQPYYNQLSGTWGQTLLTENQHTCVWVIALPMTSDAGSQAYRYLFLQGQTAGSLASQQVREPKNVSVGNLTSLSPEFVFVHKFILKYASGNWTIVESTPLSFSRASVVGTSNIYYATTENVELVPGSTTATSVLTLQNVLSNSWSSGRVSTAPTITDNGDNTVSVSTCEVMLRSSNSTSADLRLYQMPAITNKSVPLETIRYLVADYNSGSPILDVRAPGSSNVNNTSIIAMAVLANAGGYIYRTDFGDNAADIAQRTNVYLGFRYGQVVRLSGAIPTSPAGRYLQLTLGRYATGAVNLTVNAFDSTGADRFKTVYGDTTAGWTRTSSVAQLGNTHYWNPTTHLLTALSSTAGGYYTCWWVYQLIDSPNAVVAFLHNAESNAIADIRAATVPADVPIELTPRTGPAALIAKIIVRQGQANAQEVINIVSADSQQTPTSDHNSLGGLQGGTSGQYYHLTSSEYTTATTTNSMFTTNVGIGVTGVGIATQLHVASTSTSSPRGIMSSQHNNGTDGARFHLRKSRGTVGTPTVITTGDNLGRLVGSGYDGSNYLEMCSIYFATEGTIAATRIPTNIQFWTATDAAPSVLTERMRITAAGRVGIGLTAPATELHVASSSTSSPRGIMSSQHNAGTDGARIHGRKSRGTAASPGVISTGDMITRWVGSAFDGTNYLEMCSIDFVSTGTIATTRIPTDMVFNTATDAAPSVLTERMRITNAGRVGIGLTAPATELHVATTSTSSPRGIMSSQHSTGTDGARIHGRKSRGTAASPTVIVTGDMLTRWVGSGYDGSNYLEMASIDFVSTGTIASTRVPTKIVINTATDAAPSVLTERMSINEKGTVKTAYGVAYARRTATATGSITVADHFVDADHASTAIELTLAAISTFQDGQEIVVTRTNLATVRVTANSGEYINGSAFVDLPNMYSSISIHSNGTGWIIH